jgi:3-oxoacyl-[acyl-carrier protein] reductase
MVDLEGKVALVTGASKGIGREIAMQLADNGATVIVNYSGSEQAAQDTVNAITERGGIAENYHCNVTDFEAVAEMITYIVQKHNKLDILINNAGITKDGLLMKMSEEDFDQVVNVNLKGTFNCIRHVSRQMIKQRGGRIINMSSVVGIAGNAGQANYAASKAGIIGITKSAAKELASRGITVNAIAPGYIDTDMTKVLSDSVKEKVLGAIPLGRMGKVRDIADIAIFLASDKGSYLTGQVISVDGGMNI